MSSQRPILIETSHTLRFSGSVESWAQQKTRQERKQRKNVYFRCEVGNINRFEFVFWVSRKLRNSGLVHGVPWVYFDSETVNCGAKWLLYGVGNPKQTIIVGSSIDPLAHSNILFTLAKSILDNADSARCEPGGKSAIQSARAYERKSDFLRNHSLHIALPFATPDELIALKMLSD